MRLFGYSVEAAYPFVYDTSVVAWYSFQYDEEYLKSAMPPISATLPKKVTAYSSEHLFPFFSNMLPEGANRRVICRVLKIDENDFFGLLETMADRDFIGAVNVRRIKND